MRATQGALFTLASQCAPPELLLLLLLLLLLQLLTEAEQQAARGPEGAASCWADAQVCGAWGRGAVGACGVGSKLVMGTFSVPKLLGEMQSTAWCRHGGRLDQDLGGYCLTASAQHAQRSALNCGWLQVVDALQEVLAPPEGMGGKHVVLWARQPELLQVCKQTQKRLWCSSATSPVQTLWPSMTAFYTITLS